MLASDEREEQLAFPEIRAVKIFLIKIGRGLVIEGADDERAVYRCDGHGASEGCQPMTLVVMTFTSPEKVTRRIPRERMASLVKT